MLLLTRIVNRIENRTCNDSGSGPLALQSTVTPPNTTVCASVWLPSVRPWEELYTSKYIGVYA